MGAVDFSFMQKKNAKLEKEIATLKEDNKEKEDKIVQLENEVLKLKKGKYVRICTRRIMGATLIFFTFTRNR